MKLIRCNVCNDVVRLIHIKWRQCECEASGGQYNGTSMSATVGGDCEVIGIRNDFFEYPKFSPERNDTNGIIQGEYLGDVQVFRIESGDGPALEMTFEKRNLELLRVVFTDTRKYHINLDGNTSPEWIFIPFSDKPSFINPKE